MDLYLGEADQWQKVITELNSIHISELNIREIEIQDPVDYLHPTIRKICNKLKPLIRESWKLNENYVDKNNLTKIKKAGLFPMGRFHRVDFFCILEDISAAFIFL